MTSGPAAPEHNHEGPRARIVYRTIDDGSEEKEIFVAHFYLPEGEAGECGHCGSPAHDPGLIALSVGDETAMLTAEAALVLANRITRTANLVLESEEDVPDIEREAARFAASRAGETTPE